MSRVTNAIITAHVGSQGNIDPEIDSVNRFLRVMEGGWWRVQRGNTARWWNEADGVSRIPVSV